MKELNFYRIFKDEGISFGWKHAKKNFWFFLQIFILILLVNALPSIINFITGRPWDASNIGDVLSLAIGLIFSFGMIKIFIRIAQEKAVDLKHLINHDWKDFLRWLVVVFIIAIVAFIVAFVVAFIVTILEMTITHTDAGQDIGMIAGILAAVYCNIRFYFAQYYIIDKKMNAINALKASWSITKGHMWQILGILLLTIGISLLGFLVIGIGLLWAIPTIYLAQAKLYDKLTSHHHEG